MASAEYFHCFSEDLAHKVHNLGSDTLKVMLTNVAPDLAADTVDGDITEITAENGYAAGGLAVNRTASGQTGGIYEFIGDDVVFTADVGTSFGPAQYAVLVNVTAGTAGNRPLICRWNRGSSTSATDTVPIRVRFDQTDGVLRFVI